MTNQCNELDKDIEEAHRELRRILRLIAPGYLFSLACEQGVGWEIQLFRLTGRPAVSTPVFRRSTLAAVVLSFKEYYRGLIMRKGG